MWYAITMFIQKVLIVMHVITAMLASVVNVTCEVIVFSNLINVKKLFVYNIYYLGC